MKIQTALLGELEIDENYILNFTEGIPAFEEEKQFVLLPMEDKGPFYYLQSIYNEDLCLLLAEPFVFFPHYEIEVADEELHKLGIDNDKGSMLVYVILTVPDDFKLTTANLLAPIIINPESKKATQYIAVNTKYTTRHLIFPQEQPAQVASAAEGR